jgi:hypothetical protein
MLADMDIPFPKSEEALANDPFLLLGYGVNSYFDICLRLFWVFTFISIFFIPAFEIYSKNSERGLFGAGASKYAIN